MIALLPILRWLTGNGGLTLATWGLVIATFFLYRDSRQKGQEQREHWNDEDARRKMEAAPKSEFGLNSNGSEITLWCANLGTASFVLTEMKVRPMDSQHSTPHAIGPTIVSVGQMVKHNVPLNLLSGINKNWEISLRLDGPHEAIETRAKFFYSTVVKSHVNFLKPYFSGEETINCPRCKADVHIYSRGGLAFSDEFQKELEHMRRVLETSCPEHKSTSQYFQIVSQTQLGQ